MQPFDYHASTKHSYNSVRMYPNRLDWDNQPSHFKFYADSYERISLDYDNEHHRLLLLTAGITAKKTYPGVEYYLRVNPSAGALYPNEIYFQSRNVDGFKDGIYHFEIATNSAVLLYEFKSNEGLEHYFNQQESTNGLIILISSLYYRSAWKYKNRAFRYCLLDAGHLLGSLEASCYLQNRDYKIFYDFDKKNLNEMFGFEKQEFFNAAFFVTTKSKGIVKNVELQLPFQDGTKTFEQNELIEFAYAQTLNQTPHPQTLSSHFTFNKEVFKEIIIKRRSIRGFSKQAISKEAFETVVKNVMEPIASDCDEEINVYYVINRVESMPLGLYFNEAYLKQGDFKSKAGYLCLEQELGKDSAVTFFITSKSKNYQAMYQKAGIIGHRIYLTANYLGIGCSGIGAYYDDEVNEFLENDEMVLYALAIGN